MYIYVYNHTITYSGRSSGTSSGVPTSPVGCAPAWLTRRAADRAGRGAVAATAGAAAVLYTHTHTLKFQVFGYFEQSEKHVFSMLIYTENYSESHRNIQINNL